jgi:hypothetical protein
MTKEHKIKYDNQMVEADTFLGYIDNVEKVEYNGEILYNVLMKKYEKINVNNLICETLHPQNKIAKIYNSNFSEDYKNRLIRWTNKKAIEDAKNKLLEYENEKLMQQELEKRVYLNKIQFIRKFSYDENTSLLLKINKYKKNKEIEDVTKITKMKKGGSSCILSKINNYKKIKETENITKIMKKVEETKKEENTHSHTQKPKRYKGQGR